ncbi:UDP-3-O-acyl-N-acetylglucosamine deacetylase [Teredinibacter franksiae]|uniref:UDP-3-O-acyl-N-acetylglucosamine deacetylase n=1 Tax=Teredinibacter franksiae TaxID=2761453 RepID=UPI001625B134|nr:UDP-3-O-acyl-N-acetylglucosamine deacetylase [Teredinibacter franksiae]
MMMKPLQDRNTQYAQQTLKKPFTCIGRGLHTGLKVIMTVMPAEANSGYRFVRRDVSAGRNEVIAAWHTVTETNLCTTVSNNMGVRVSTIEHLIAALYANGVDNARIVLDGPEVPIMDGSAKPFSELIESVGLETLEEERKAIVITDTITVRDGKKEASLIPSPTSWITMEIDFESSVIGRQSLSLEMGTENFNRELADSRTFGFVDQMNTLQALGYARGGSLQNAVLVAKNGVINKDGLRHENEFIRHKMLDAIGDLALSGAPIIGSFSAKYSGHKLNNELLRKLLQSQNAYQYVPLREVSDNWVEMMNVSAG